MFVEAVPVRFFEVTAKLVAHSHVSEAVMLVDLAAAQASLYVYSDMLTSARRSPISELGLAPRALTAP